LWQRRRASNYNGDGERVFCHPEKGTRYRAEPYREALKRAFKTAGLE
jgi:hypothetical protein